MSEQSWELPLPTRIDATAREVLGRVLTNEASAAPLTMKAFRASMPSEAHRDALGSLTSGDLIQAGSFGYRLRLRGVLVLAREPVPARWIALCDMVLAIVPSLFHEREDLRVSCDDVFARRTIQDATRIEVAHAVTLLDDAALWGGHNRDNATSYVTTFALTEKAAYAGSLAALVREKKLFADAYRRNASPVPRVTGPASQFVAALRAAREATANAAARLGTHRCDEIRSRVERAALELDDAFSGSWFGYHSRLYLEGLHPRGAGDHFDIEWGLYDAMSNTTTGSWSEYRAEEIRRAVLARAAVSSDEIDGLVVVAREVEAVAAAERDRIIPVLHALVEMEPSPRVASMIADIEKTKLRLHAHDLLAVRRPSQAATRDPRAHSSHRLEDPAHLVIWSHVLEQFSVRVQCEKLRDAFAQVVTTIEAKALLRENTGAVATAEGSRAVFVVHGHDLAAKHEAARVIQKLGLHPVILDEQTNRGRTIIEKFEDHAKECAFAVVLLTPDDVGRARTAASDRARARQNVVFELGYFMAKLGRGHVCALHGGDLELPSDVQGVIYISLDGGGWKLDMAKEMKAAGLRVDLNDLM